MPPPRTVLVLYLTGFFSGGLQVIFSVSMAQVVPFDMAATSFDDQYNDCVDQMEDKVGALHDSEVYAKAWEGAAAKWNEIKSSVSVPEGFRAEYAVAALAYTQKETFLYRDLNTAVETGGKSEDYYLKDFDFKAFHFFLTRALQVLQTNTSFQCRETYRGVKGIRFMAEPAQKARFGYFASSSLNKTEAMNFGRDTFFTIKTCYGASIKEFSFYPEEEEVLIPPFEVFQVADSIQTPDGIHISLISAGIFSKYNCVYVKDGSVNPWSANLQAPFLLWGFLLFSGVFGSPGFL